MTLNIRATLASLSLAALTLTGCGAPSTTASGADPSSAVSRSTAGAAREGDTRFDADITNNSLAVSPDEKTAVVSDSREKSLLIYDLANGGVRRKLDGFITPRNIVFINNGAQFVVSDSSLGTLRFYGTADAALQDEVVVGPGAFGTAVSPDGKTMYVNNQAHGSVTLVDVEHRKPVAVITGFSQPRQGIKVSPDGKLVLVTNFAGDKVSIVDVDSRRIVRDLTGFSKIRGISVSADGTTLYAANSGRDTVSVVDLGTGEVRKDVRVGREPYGAALSPDGKLLFASSKADDTIDVIDTATNSVVKTLTGFKEPRQAIIFNHDQSRAYVLNRDLSVARVNVAGLSVVDTVRE